MWLHMWIWMLNLNLDFILSWWLWSGGCLAGPRAGTAHEGRLWYRDGPACQTGPRAVLVHSVSINSPHGFNYYITQRIVVRVSGYEHLGLKDSNQKMEVIAKLLGALLGVSPPQVTLSIIRIILNFIHQCQTWSSSRILHLPNYPQGRGRFTSISVCKL